MILEHVALLLDDGFFQDDFHYGVWLYSNASILIVLVISRFFVYSLGYKSWAELLNSGLTKDGVFQILSDQSEVMDIYCDQSSWGGGNRNHTSCYP